MYMYMYVYGGKERKKGREGREGREGGEGGREGRREGGREGREGGGEGEGGWEGGRGQKEGGREGTTEFSRTQDKLQSKLINASDQKFSTVFLHLHVHISKMSEHFSTVGMRQRRERDREGSSDLLMFFLC